MERQKKQNFWKRIEIAFLIVCCLLMFVASPFLGSLQFASAEETALGGANKFDNTNVLDDLLSANENFIANFPPNENADPEIQLINFVEYCYSYKEDKRANYGLYLYIYNPTGLNIQTLSKENKIQLGVAYDTNPVTSESKVTDYDKFDLKFCNASKGQYENLYLKFRVVDKVGKDGKLIAQRVNSAARRYDISGIELVIGENPNATEYTIANTYTFTGYAKGCAFNEDSDKDTLKCESSHLDTISLDVKHTFYRTNTSSKGAGWHNQIDSVYFRVPELYFEKYGNLQRIKAEWFEFVTKDVVVTSQKDFYDAALPYLAKKIGNNTIDTKVFPWFIFDKTKDGFSNTDWAWNSTFADAPNVDAIYYLFYVSSFGSYNPTSSVNAMGGIESEDLIEYFRSYDKSFENGTIEIGTETISADLFESDIQEDRKIDNEIGKIQSGFNGKSYYDFDASLDLISLMSWSGTSHSFWENASNWGFFNTLFGNLPKEENIEDIAPIYIVTEKDLNLKDADLINKLFINADDVQAIRNEYATAKANNEKLVLFRFAKSDYLSKDVSLLKHSNNLAHQTFLYENRVYRAKETVFLNFDIIQLTFLQKDIYTTIPVVSNPIDIVASITPPFKLPTEWPWWLWLIVAIAVGTLLLIVLSIFKAVKGFFEFIWKIIKGIFTAIWSIVKWLAKALWWLITAPLEIFKD